MALPLVHAARHNDVKPLLGRELMILTHDDDDDDVCMSLCVTSVSLRSGLHLMGMYVCMQDDGSGEGGLANIL